VKKSLKLYQIIFLISVILAIFSGCTGENSGESNRDTHAPGLRGYVLYIPGIIPSIYDEDAIWNAKDRAEGSFPPELCSLVEGYGYEPCWFSYKSTGAYEGQNGDYTSMDTRQHLSESAKALNEQIVDLIDNIQNAEDIDSKSIIIVTHSLGGAVAAYWASGAEDNILDNIGLVVTFDSPLSGITGERAIFGAPVSFELMKPETKDRMNIGTSRIPFAQVGNENDWVVKLEESFTEYAWRKFEISCSEGDNHSCSMNNQEALDFVRAILEEITG
jgi:predicted alpha/beta hydrolase family esterase